MKPFYFSDYSNIHNLITHHPYRKPLQDGRGFYSRSMGLRRPSDHHAHIRVHRTILPIHRVKTENGRRFFDGRTQYDPISSDFFFGGNKIVWHSTDRRTS